MHWISQLSLRRASLFAFAWPLALCSLVLIAWAVAKLYGVVVQRRSGGVVTYVVHFQVTSWSHVSAILILPPIIFLGWWAVARR
jgi:hypothetical protein